MSACSGTRRCTSIDVLLVSNSVLCIGCPPATTNGRYLQARGLLISPIHHCTVKSLLRPSLAHARRRVYTDVVCITSVHACTPYVWLVWLRLCMLSQCAVFAGHGNFARGVRLLEIPCQKYIDQLRTFHTMFWSVTAFLACSLPMEGDFIHSLL